MPVKAGRNLRRMSEANGKETKKKIQTNQIFAILKAYEYNIADVPVLK